MIHKIHQHTVPVNQLQWFHANMKQIRNVNSYLILSYWKNCCKTLTLVCESYFINISRSSDTSNQHWIKLQKIQNWRKGILATSFAERELDESPNKSLAGRQSSAIVSVGTGTNCPAHVAECHYQYTQSVSIVLSLCYKWWIISYLPSRMNTTELNTLETLQGHCRQHLFFVKLFKLRFHYFFWRNTLSSDGLNVWRIVIGNKDMCP